MKERVREEGKKKEKKKLYPVIGVGAEVERLNASLQFE